MTDKIKDNKGFRSGVVRDKPAVPQDDVSEPEPVDFSVAISEIENTSPALLGGAALGLAGSPLTEEGLKGVSMAAAPVAFPGPIAGYDLVEDKEGAILLCGLIVYRAVEAMNKAHNETPLSWADSRDSILAGVRRVIENPNESPEANHNAWMEFRRAEGWTYGITKDPVKKTHPCMVPFSALGPFAQSKDMVFLAIVRTFFGV